MKRIFKSVFSYLCSLGACACIAAIAAIILLKSTVFSESFMLEAYNKSDYYSFLKGEIIEAYDAYGAASGLPKEFFDDAVVNAMWVYEDLNGWTKSAYRGEGYSVDKEKLYADLEKKVYLYAEQAMIEVDEEAKEGVSNFVSECVSEYEKRIGFPLLQSIGAFKVKYGALMDILAVVLSAAIIGFFFLLEKIEGLISGSLKNISLAFMGGGLIFAVPSGVILFSGVIMRIGVVNPSFYYFITTYGSVFFSYALIAGLIIFSLGMFFKLLSWRLEGDAQKKINEPIKAE